MNIQDSLHRLLQEKESVAELFYAVFFERCPEARPYFQDVDMRRQGMLLAMALLIIERNYVCAYPAAESYLRYLGTRHHTRGIPLELYPAFRESLLQTLGRVHGDGWDEALAKEWGAAIDLATALMRDGYSEPLHRLRCCSGGSFSCGVRRSPPLSIFSLCPALRRHKMQKHGKRRGPPHSTGKRPSPSGALRQDPPPRGTASESPEEQPAHGNLGVMSRPERRALNPAVEPVPRTKWPLPGQEVARRPCGLRR
jgi:hemoglobin-like flavoprotein